MRMDVKRDFGKAGKWMRAVKSKTTEKAIPEALNNTRDRVKDAMLTTFLRKLDRPTVLIGNVSISEAGKILGTRVVDRIKDNGRLLFFEWDSYRKVRQ